LGLCDSGELLGLNPGQLDIVVIGQPIAGTSQVEQVAGEQLLLICKAIEEAVLEGLNADGIHGHWSRRVCGHLKNQVYMKALCKIHQRALVHRR
jgi:hypothetical protein